MLTPIRAVDERVIPFPPGDVWSVLTDVASYPHWWPRGVAVRLLQTEAEIVGTTFELRPRGGRSFHCRIESLAPPRQMCLRYFGGFIDGRGEWRLENLGSATRLQYELDVLAAGRLVAWIGRFLPLGRLHSSQMQQVLRNLENEVAARGLARSPADSQSVNL